MKITKRTNKGFTIVELLIVIVVIGILATIVIVAYTGITARAKAAAALSEAQAVDQKAEVYNGSVGNYPAIADFATAPSEATLPAGISLISFTAAESGGLNDGDGQNTVAYEVCTNGSSNVGAQIIWWDYTGNELSNADSGLNPNTYLLGTTSGSGISCS